MFTQGLTDIDTLCLAVRDRESRRLILEAITAYRGGALRSAIMSTWIAVAYDIISKARELAAQGEAAPKAFVSELDSAIGNSDLRKLQSIESELLKTANDKLQLFAPHEYDLLRRMQDDRNLCAHPAFVRLDELYQPTPEAVRAHQVHALQYLLVHAPLQGKSAVARFEADVLSTSFPTSNDDISTYVRTKYLDRAKDNLVSSLIKGLLTAPFGSESTKFIGKERLLAKTLRVISEAKTAIYDQIAPDFIRRHFDGVGDEVLLKLCAFFEADRRIWNWISEPVRLRVRNLLAIAEPSKLKALSAFDAFALPELATVLLERFDSFDRETQIGLIAENPRQEFVDRAIDIFRSASSWRTAETLGETLILSIAPLLDAKGVQKVLTAVESNGQIATANGTPAILEKLFVLTNKLLNDTRDAWQQFVVAMTLRHGGGLEVSHYSYPNIRSRLAAT